MWLQDLGFLELVKKWWKEEKIVESKMYFFNTRLKRVKKNPSMQ